MMTLQKHTLITLAAGSICLWQGALLAAESVSAADREFLKKASEINVAEIEGGQVAQKNGGSPEVKMMGEHIVRDHEKSEAELQKLAAAKGVEIKEDTTSGKKAMMAAMEKVTGKKFDKEFAEHQTKDHQRSVALFETAAKESKDPEIKAYAEKNLPALRHHLAMAEKAQGGEKAAKQ